MTSSARSPGTTLQLQVLSSRQDIALIVDAWEQLAATAGSPMYAAGWYINALRHVHPNSDQPHVIAIWDKRQLVGIAPLILVQGSHGRRYEIIGAKVLYEPTAMLTANENAAELLAHEVASLRHPTVLTRLIGKSAFNEAFERRARRAGVVVSPSASGSPYVDLAGDWDHYYQGLPSRLKNVIRRGFKQLSKAGTVEFEFLRPRSDEVADLLQQAFAVEMRSWKGRAGSAVLLKSELRDFFFAYAAQVAAQGQLVVSFLRLNGAPIAMQVANLSHQAYWQLKIGYDEAYAKQLAGLQLQLETIKWTRQQNCHRYEFLGTAEPWIREWTSSVHFYRTLVFYPFNLSGIGAFLRDNAARVWNRLARYRRVRGKLS
jgi:CelD/BcsL family acetyltransferase involved in cellulose biosynthesis